MLLKETQTELINAHQLSTAKTNTNSFVDSFKIETRNTKVNIFVNLKLFCFKFYLVDLKIRSNLMNFYLSNAKLKLKLSFLF